jgi:hypothetical protein
MIGVHQRNAIEGCIPASFEWLLKYRGISLGTNWDVGFQEKVNCHAGNHYSTVTDKIAAIFGFDRKRIEWCEYEARQKCTEIKKWIDTGKGCLVSLPSGGNFHIMPAVAYDADKLTVLDLANPLSNQVKQYLWDDIIKYHNTLRGGQDICWIND